MGETTVDFGFELLYCDCGPGGTRNYFWAEEDDDCPHCGLPPTREDHPLPESKTHWETRVAFEVTDDLLDAPDGAVVDGFERVGTDWMLVAPLHSCFYAVRVQIPEVTP